MAYSLGGVMRKDVNQFFSGMLSTNYGMQGNINTDFLNRWQKAGDEKNTNIPGYLPVEDYSNRNTQYYTNADVNVVSSSYLKMNEAGVAYNLNVATLHWLRIQSATVRAQVNNILMWKANKAGIDPVYQNPLFNSRNLPANQHTITVGMNVNF